MRLHKGKMQNGQWVYGYPVPTETNCYDKGVELVDYISYDELDYYQPSVWGEDIIEDTLCEFTGAYDKTTWNELTLLEKAEFAVFINNGKDVSEYEIDKASDFWFGRPIFEYDVIKVDNLEDTFIVQYDAEHAMYTLSNEKDYDEEYDFLFISPKMCRVIGNRGDDFSD